MDWNIVSSFITPELMVVVIVCNVIGYILKKTPKVPNWSIVYIVTGFAVALALLLVGLSVSSFIQGVLCGAVSVYGHQLVTQATKVKE